MRMVWFNNRKLRFKGGITKPASQHRASHFPTPDQRDLVFCHENYASPSVVNKAAAAASFAASWPRAT